MSKYPEQFKLAVVDLYLSGVLVHETSEAPMLTIRTSTATEPRTSASTYGLYRVEGF